MDRTTKEIPKPVAPPHVDIPDDWKEKKISSYKKKSKEKPEFSPLPKETLLYNRYTIIDVIHTDCYGSIYKAIDSKARDKATEIRAIKEIQYSLSECGCVSRMEEVMDMIKKISSFLQDIDYPGLVKIYDYFYDINEEKGARFFIVMEFIEGKTLEEVLQSYAKDKKSLSPKKMFQAIINICDTLFYLHNRKPFPIAFVDLKPSNIIISRDEKMKFINYGMGRIIINQSDFSYEYRGSLGYSAPEQKGVDFTNIKADIFAFGSVFYYLLTGINPEDNPYEFKSIKDTKPFISDKVEKFIFKCVSIHPEERPDIEKIRDTIRSFDFFELDTSTEDSKPLEDKKEIATKKRKEPLDKVSKKKAVEKSGGMSGTLIAVITAVIVIIIFILLKIFKIF
ncbi:MAG: Serine/threonine-protein kinase PK-1 [bacterium ADurb.Bin363]|nr:MAG: Serine/threonine-protein kinase PK-1 [bacterium ADurb.Bin363]